jgi:hypothetical protein
MHKNCIFNLKFKKFPQKFQPHTNLSSSINHEKQSSLNSVIRILLRKKKHLFNKKPNLNSKVTKSIYQIAIDQVERTRK